MCFYNKIKEVSVSENETLRYIAVTLEEGVVLSWEELQQVKDYFYPTE